MLDSFLAVTYEATRRETTMAKIAQQIASATSGDRLPPTPQAEGTIPTIRPNSPPQQSVQGGGLGGQAPMGVESGMKFASERTAFEKQASERMLRKIAMGKLALNILENANLGKLLKHHAVPLATTGVGAIGGAAYGASDGGGLSGAIGGGLLGGAAGSAAGKGGQLLHRAAKIKGFANRNLAEGVEGMGIGDALKRSWNTEVARNAKHMGIARPEGMSFGVARPGQAAAIAPPAG